MNVTQRKYTLDRLNSLTSIKINALVEENDVLVKANNDNYKITKEELVLCVEQDPSLLTLKETSSDSCEVFYTLDHNKIREMLGKPTVLLNYSRNSYVNDAAKHLQTVAIINNTSRVLLIEIADRITKLQHRSQYAKDLIMLGDAKEAMQALEDFNSLIF